jgi:hypothetical protein
MEKNKNLSQYLLAFFYCGLCILNIKIAKNSPGLLKKLNLYEPRMENAK